MHYEINILNDNIEIPKELIEAAGENELIARLFFNRGFNDPEIIRQMLDDSSYQPTKPNEFPGINRAVNYIIEAFKKGWKIAVYGDYDVDGVTSTALLVQCLRMFTKDIIYHVPDRFKEGYGMNGNVVKALSEQGVKLIITCDCGISNHNEIALAKELGMSVIITDHHTLPDSLPPADVILNPKLLPEDHRARNISGCGMAYFLSLAILEHYGQSEKAEDFLDLLAMSIVADVVKLTGENRYLLKKSIPKLFNSERAGLKALFTIIGTNKDSQNEEDIAFQLAPRINAAGRMDTARLPVELMLTMDMNEAAEAAQRLDTLNKERKRIQQEIIREAEELVESGRQNNTILVLFNEFWHHGIIGIAAGKICETYGRPTILLSMKEDGETVVGSARSVKDINIYELIKECSKRLQKFGGHSLAAGLSLKRQDLEGFVQEIEMLAEKKYFIKDTHTIDVDMNIALNQITEEFNNGIESAGPFGEGFIRPLFYSEKIFVASDRKTESNHHIMLLAGSDNSTVKAVKWFGEGQSLEGKTFNMIYAVKRNTYGGDNQLQLTVEHMLEVSGEDRVIFKGSFVDARSIGRDQILEQYGNAALYYEGLKYMCPVDDTQNRYRQKKAKTLVFLTVPVNTKIFKEVILFSNPDKVIMNFSYVPDYSYKGFMLNLMGILKHLIERNGGYGYIEDVAVKLCIEEGVIKASLKNLKVLGKIDYIFDSDENRLLVLKGSGITGSRSEVIAAERNVKNALEEKNAYLHFILKLEIDKFMAYLK